MVRQGRRSVGWVAILAIALHTILTGLAPLTSAAPADPFGIICHSGPADASPVGQGGLPVGAPSGACDHCNLCSAIATPLAPGTSLDSNLAPDNLVEVLFPVSLAPAGGIARTPRLARGPPQRV